MNPPANKAVTKGGTCRTCGGKGMVTLKGKQVRCADCGGRGTIGYRTK